MDNLQFLRGSYGLLLNLFPRTYREEYGDELRTVFELSLDDALRTGKVEVGRIALRELVSMPQAILNEHLRERRKMKMTGKFISRFDFPQGSKIEPLVALLPFIVFFSIFYFIASMVNPDTSPWLVAPILLGSFFIILAIGFIKGLPRWFLPFLGFFFSIISTMILNPFALNPDWRGFPFLYQVPRFIRGLIHEAFFWMGLIVLLFLLVLFTALISKFRSFYMRLQEDRTLLAFIVYGATPLALFLTFDDYQNEGPYEVAACLILIVGGWFYLRNKTLGKRFFSLFLGLALSMGVAAAGKWILYTPTPGFGFTKFSEMMGTVVTWFWLALIMLLSLAINRLPRAGASRQTSLSEG